MAFTLEEIKRILNKRIGWGLYQCTAWGCVLYKITIKLMLMKAVNWVVAALLLLLPISLIILKYELAYQLTSIAVGGLNLEVQHSRTRVDCPVPLAARLAAPQGLAEFQAYTSAGERLGQDIHQVRRWETCALWLVGVRWERWSGHRFLCRVKTKKAAFDTCFNTYTKRLLSREGV